MTVQFDGLFEVTSDDGEKLETMVARVKLDLPPEQYQAVLESFRSDTEEEFAKVVYQFIPDNLFPNRDFYLIKVLKDTLVMSK